MMTTPTADPTQNDALFAVAAVKDVLARERSAIARLDAGALELVSQEKRLVASVLQGLLPIGGETPRALRDALTDLRCEAEANRALLDDAIGAIAEVRGLYRDSGTYDARARRRQSYSARAGRGI